MPDSASSCELRGADDVGRELHLEVERVLDAELLGHLPADQHGVRLAAEVLQDAELVIHFRAAADEHEGPLDVTEQPAEMLELAEQQQSGVRRQQPRDASVELCARCAEPNAS